MGEDLIYEADADEHQLAVDWHGGQSSMLYAVASTGSLSRGTLRPTGEDGPMSDEEWAADLIWWLTREIRAVGDDPTCDEADRAIAARWLTHLDSIGR